MLSLDVSRMFQAELDKNNITQKHRFYYMRWLTLYTQF
jgi:hypothetical protein